MEEKGLETLQVWQRAMEFATTICRDILPTLPPNEKWALSHQIRRSAQSVPANIAEGYGRYYFQDNVRFCYIARGSLEETYSHLTLANSLNYLEPETFKTLSDEIRELRRMINGYIAFLKKSKRGANDPGSNLHIRESDIPYFTEETSDILID
jgi:four helix bundle protein